MAAIAKILRSGAGQAVLLPRGFEFDVDEVCIKRIGSAVLLFPKGTAGDVMGETVGKADEDFMADRAQPRRVERRKGLGRSRG